MELGSKIAQLYKTISQPLYADSYIEFVVNYPLYLLERIARHLVKNGLVENYFEQSDFDKLRLNSEILLEIGNSIDSDIEQLSDVELRKFCKEFIDLLLAKRPQSSFGWTKGRSVDYSNSLRTDYIPLLTSIGLEIGKVGYSNSLRTDYILYDFIVELVKPSPNQIIYQPDCNLGSMFIRFSHEFPDYNLKFIGQEDSSGDENFICKINVPIWY